jgi:hypothetical protein
MRERPDKIIDLEGRQNALHSFYPKREHNPEISLESRCLNNTERGMRIGSMSQVQVHWFTEKALA